MTIKGLWRVCVSDARSFVTLSYKGLQGEGEEKFRAGFLNR